MSIILLASRALARAEFKETIIVVAKIPMMVMTTINSIKVNPGDLSFCSFFVMPMLSEFISGAQCVAQ